MWVVFGLIYPHDPEPLLLFNTESEAQVYVQKLETYKQYDSVWCQFVDINKNNKEVNK